MKIFIPQHADAVRRPDGIQKQRKIAGFANPAVGQRSGIAPPDDLTLANLVGDDRRSFHIPVHHQLRSRFRLPIVRRKHADFWRAPHQRRWKNRGKLGCFLNRVAFVEWRRVGQNFGGACAARHDASSLLQEFEDRGFIFRRRCLRRTRQDQYFVAGCPAEFGWRFFPALDVIVQILKQNVRAFRAVPIPRVARRVGRSCGPFLGRKISSGDDQNRQQHPGADQEFAVAAVEGVRHPIFSR